MCGVVAVVAPLAGSEREALARTMCARLAHRGPDGEGIWSGAPGADRGGGPGADRGVAPSADPGGGPGVTLGHRRLSIIDLSPAAAQPMQRGALCVSYNGEIYNHVELRAELRQGGRAGTTHSDTEVLLDLVAAHGVQGALARVVGMFALALWDARAQRLWLARDRFGKKPLYYLHAPGPRVLLVASEPKAILAAARALGLAVSVDRGVLASYLYDADLEAGDATFFSEIKRVRAGEIVAVDLPPDGPLALSRRRYYTLDPARCGPELTPSAETDARFAALLTDALRLRLRSDVPVGALLSGGMDSSALVCLSARRLGVRLQTFSAVYRPGDGADERRFITAAAAHAQVPNSWVEPEAELRPDAFAAFLAHHDEPVGGASVWAQHCVFKRARADGCTVVLSGQGADESLTGYRGAFPVLYAELARRGQLGRLGRELWAARAVRGSGAGEIFAALRGGGSALLRQAVLPGALSEAWLAHKWRSAARRPPPLVSPGLPLPERPAPLPEEAAWAERSLLHAYLFRLLTGSSLGTILRFEDRSSMAASVESRAPFLDHRLVELCLAQAPAALVTGGLTKALLRRSLGDVLPAAVRARTDKVGFATPEARFLTGPLRTLCGDVLHGRGLAARGLFDVPGLRRTFDAAAAGALPLGALASDAVWKAVNVELWLAAAGLSL